jgi:transcriptional regulator with XRE-family HTH domain
VGLFDRTVSHRREELGLTQGRLAERMGVSQQTVSRWESGLAIPPPDRLVALAKVLDLDEERLLGYGGYLPTPDRSRYWQDFHVMYEGITNLSDKELILLLDRAWEEHRRRQGFEAPKEPPANDAK